MAPRLVAARRFPGAFLRSTILALGLVVSGTCAAQKPGVCVVDAAREQVGVTVRYDPAYRRLAYPNGDVPRDRGVCTDVVIRAYRRLGVDLQVLVHDDMARAWAAYPKFWGLLRPDSNIDHRRVPNLAVFFARHGTALPVVAEPAAYAPGDVVTWRLPSGVPHIGIVGDRRAPSGVPLVVHNIGRGTVEEDALFLFTITGHFRFLPDRLTSACSGSGAGVIARSF